MGSIPALGRFPGGGHGNPLQYFCLENPHGQRSLAGYSPCSRKELDTTEWQNQHHQGVHKRGIIYLLTIQFPCWLKWKANSICIVFVFGVTFSLVLRCGFFYLTFLRFNRGFPQMVKNPPAMPETWVQSLGWEDALEEGMETHSSIFAWRIPIDRAAWWATVHRISKSQTLLKWLSAYSSSNSILSIIQALHP